MPRSKHSMARSSFVLLAAVGLSACGPLPWARHDAVLRFVAAESKESTSRVFLMTDKEGNSVETGAGERVALGIAQKTCEEFECDWWEYKDEKRELSSMHIRGRERESWVGYHMRFEKDPAVGWVAKADFLGAEQH